MELHSYDNVHKPVISEIEGAVEDIRSGNQSKKTQNEGSRTAKEPRLSLSCIKRLCSYMKRL